MPFVMNGSRRGSRMLAAALGLALAALAPATAQAKNDKHDAANPDACVADHALSNPFAAWGDQADYALAPGGDFESGAAGWTLTGGAAVTAGNQPFDIGAPGASSLALPQGSSALSGSMCVDETYTSFRLFARNTGRPTWASRSRSSTTTARASCRARRPASSPRRASGRRRSPWPSTCPSTPPAPRRSRSASRPQGKGGDWTIDDVYVDPYARR